MSDVIVTRAKDRTENLCETCVFHVPECEPDEGVLEFGDGIGGDNVIACDVYEHY